ncbi:bifunctional hydroxymethylpyrimidine kinase/phosphomethylpyrimidine kinase [Paracoccus limosus]|jgi:hydroxymethylpyrimidine/phosphomethylpyrimidine kinase|uniref:hydroxymethylpyrimidine kinase n=1 Tax=Paracoccus limosus TaxID=913252 RepID=A0A844H838_9RHOB|nr:bifunctional hydroxymethylpyrimidine kinase/phosphomethylpyrimidine kinase [Paracoccus limosus]MTH35461.1 bifunctional hydroxymethylpyrimidine kinase/phosphomethylpyrimidine kinase [Paracoccus limosus]
MSHPIALTIAGSDSGGGAGIQADLKSFSALGVYGASVITAITAQNTRTVAAVQPVSPAMIVAQIDAVMGDLDVRAIKIGMLGGPEVIATTADRLAALLADRPLPIVLDPVMIAKAGNALLPDEAVAVLRDRLLPLATVLTPNLPEAARLLEQPPARTEAEMLEQGAALRALGPAHVMMKGGHGQGDSCIDLLVGPEPMRLAAPRLDTRNTHGTGCSLSAAIAAGLARGETVPEAVRAAHGWLQGAIAAADDLAVGLGFGPVHHFYRMWNQQ